MTYPILVLGGYGVFGNRVCQLLALDPEIRVLVAGRSRAKAEEFCAKLRTERPSADVGAVEVNLPEGLYDAITQTGARAVIHAAGPFQEQDYSVARACIARRVHYIDLADGRKFVSRFTELNYQARDAGVCAISGASTLPGLSSAVVEDLANDIETVEEIEIGIAPGNRNLPGEASIAAVLSYAGQPIRTLSNGRWSTLHGWQHLRRYAFKHFGATLVPARWFALCDVPDLQLLPTRYTSLRTLMFRAGLELPRMQFGMWAGAWLVRRGLIKNLDRFRGFFARSARRLESQGSDCGGMYVEVKGHDAAGQRCVKTWALVAKSGHGPTIPAIPSVILARRIARGAVPGVGARACLGLFTLREFEAAVSDLDIVMWREDRNA